MADQIDSTISPEDKIIGILSSSSIIADAIERNVNCFSATKTMASLVGNQGFSSGACDFFSGHSTNNSGVWQSLSAIADGLGEDIYSNVLNYIDNVSNVDVCKVRSLRSMMLAIGAKYLVVDKIQFYPIEVQSLIDILSINKKYLLNNQFIKSSFIDALCESGVAYLSNTVLSSPYVVSCEYDSSENPILSTVLSANATSISSSLDYYVFDNTTFEKAVESILHKFLYDMLSMPIVPSDQLCAFFSQISGYFADVSIDELSTQCMAYNQISLSDDYGPEQIPQIDQYARQKKSLNVKSSFDVIDEVDKIEVGQASLYDYTGDELVLIYQEIERRRQMTTSISSVAIVNRIARNSYYRKKKVIEYAKFVDSVANYNSQISDYSTYRYDPNYYIAENANASYVLYKDEDGYHIDDNIVAKAAKNLVAIVDYVRKIREVIRFQVRKVYMKGTNALLEYCVNEFLIDYATQLQNTFDGSQLSTVSSIVNSLSMHDWIDVQVQEYWDRTEYMNLSTDTSQYAYNRRKVNPRYFDEVFSPDGEDGALVPKDGTGVFDNDDINTFYLSALGLKNTLLPAKSTLSSASQLSSRFYAFLSVLFDTAANNSYYDDKYKKFGTSLQTESNGEIITHDIYEDLSTLLSVDAEVMSVANEANYSFSELSTIKQQIDGLFSAWTPLLEEKYLSQVSTTYDTYFPQIQSISSDFQSEQSNLSNLLNQKYSSYFCKSTNSYSYSEDGSYLFPYFVGDPKYPSSDYYLVYLNNAIDWISENCHTYALSNAIQILSTDYDNIQMRIYNDLVNPLTLSGFIDMGLADQSEEMDLIKSFLNGRIDDRTEYLQQALQNFRDQAQQLKSAYDSYVVSFQSILASMPDTSQGWYIKWVGKGNGKLKAATTTKKDADGAIYDQYSQKIYIPDDDGAFISVDFKSVNDVKDSYTLIQNINCALSRLDECSNIFYGISIISTQLGAAAASGSTVSRSFGTQKQALQALIASIVGLGKQIDSILNQVKEMYQIDANASDFTSIYVKGSTDVNIDYNAKILALIAYLGTKISEAEFAQDVILSSYNVYLKTLTEISSTYIPIRNEYEVLWSKFTTFLQDLEKTSDYKVFKPENLFRLEDYRINKDRTALAEIQNDLGNLVQNYQQLVTRFINICSSNIELYKSVSLKFVYQYTGDVLELCLNDFITCLIKDVSIKTTIGNNSIDDEKHHMHDIIDVILVGALPSGIEGLYYKYFKNQMPYFDTYIKYETWISDQKIAFTEIIQRLKSLLEYSDYSYFGQQKIMFQNYSGIVFSNPADNQLLDGELISEDPYYNHKNQTHPSYQIHPFLWYFDAKSLVQYAIDSIATSLVNIDYADLKAEYIANALDNYIGEFGNLIDVWRNNIHDFTSYQTRYEQSNHICKYTGLSSVVVDYDGAFYPDALSSYFSSWNQLLSNDFLSTWYSHLNIDNDQHMKAVVISGLSQFDEISALTQPTDILSDVNDIYSYQLDQYGNAYILYKKYGVQSPTEEQMLSTSGELWIRLADSPIAFKHSIAVNVDQDFIDNNSNVLDKLVDFQISPNGNKGIAAYQTTTSVSGHIVNAVKALPFAIDCSIGETSNCGISKVSFSTSVASSSQYSFYNKYQSLPYERDIDASTSSFKYQMYVGMYSYDASMNVVFIDCIVDNTNGVQSKRIPDNPVVYVYSIYTDDSSANVDSSKHQLSIKGIVSTHVPMSFYVNASTDCIIDLAFIVQNDHSGHTTIAKRWPTGDIGGENALLSIDFDKHTAGCAIDGPRQMQMNSFDVFAQTLKVVSVPLGNSRQKSQSSTKVPNANILDFQTNADIGYNPSYAGLSGCGPLDVKEDLSALSYSAIELLGKEKDLDALAGQVNANPDPYLTKTQIYDKYLFGRIWESGASNTTGQTWIYDQDDSLVIYGNIPMFTSMPSVSATVTDKLSAEFTYDSSSNSFLWTMPMARHIGNDAEGTKLFLYTVTSFGKNPYIVDTVSNIVTKSRKGKWIEADYDVGKYSSNNFSFSIGTGHKVDVAGTQNGVNQVDNGYSNVLDNVSSIRYRCDKDYSLSIQFYLDDVRPSFIDTDTIKLALVDNFDIKFFEWFHLLDFGATYEDTIRELNKVADLPQIEKDMLLAIDLSSYNALSDVVVDGKQIFGSYRRLAFKVDESDVFELSSPNFYVPSLNTKYPLTFAQAYDMNYSIGSLIADDVVHMFNQDEVYLIDAQNSTVMNDLSTIAFSIPWENDPESILAYEDYLQYDDSLSCENSQKYPIESPNFFQYVQFYGRGISASDDPDVEQGISICLTEQMTSDLVSIDLDSTDAFSQYIALSTSLSAAMLETSQMYAIDESYFDYTSTSKQEKEDFLEFVKRFLQIHMSYRRTSNGIVLYANYQNYINSPYIKIVNGKTYVDTIPLTYARILPNEDAQLNIIVQFRMYSAGKLKACRNAMAASYMICNISDDKPKFILKKLTDKVVLIDDDTGLGQPAVEVSVHDMHIKGDITVKAKDEVITEHSTVEIDCKNYIMSSPISCTIAYPSYLASIGNALPDGVTKVEGLNGQVVVEFTPQRRKVQIPLEIKKTSINKYNKTKHQIPIIDVENSNPFDVTIKNGTMYIACNVTIDYAYLFFDSNGGSGQVDPILSILNEEVVIPSSVTQFTRVGHSMKDPPLNSKPNGSGSSYSPNDIMQLTAYSTTLYAQWQPNIYSINFNANGGDGEMASLAVEYDTAVVLPNCGFQKIGHTFTNWKFNDAVYYPNNATLRMPAYDMTLYAQWQPNSYLVQFLDQDGTVLKSNYVQYGSAAIAPPDPSHIGYVFDRWEPRDYSYITANIDIVAQYRVKEEDGITEFKSDDVTKNGFPKGYIGPNKQGTITPVKLKFASGQYELTAIGPGGGSSTETIFAGNYWVADKRSASGGSGAFLSGYISLASGSVLNVTVANGASGKATKITGNGINIIVGAGHNGDASTTHSHASGGIVSKKDGISSVAEKNGNSGGYARATVVGNGSFPSIEGAACATKLKYGHGIGVGTTLPKNTKSYGFIHIRRVQQ